MSGSSEIFARRKTISTYWLNKSNDLGAAAAALWHSMDRDVSDVIVERFEFGRGFDMRAAVPDVFRMLCGMSLELLYKAIIVSRGDNVAHTHDLAALARHAGVDISEHDAGLLRILTESVKWDGRYPVPKDAASFEDLSSLEQRHLVDYDTEADAGRFRIGRPNRALAWDGFARLRAAAITRYLPSSL